MLYGTARTFGEMWPYGKILETKRKGSGIMENEDIDAAYIKTDNSCWLWNDDGTVLINVKLIQNVTIRGSEENGYYIFVSQNRHEYCTMIKGNSFVEALEKFKEIIK
jgi:hypothetical protein